MGGDVFIKEVLNIAWEELTMRFKLTEIKQNLITTAQDHGLRTNMNFKSKIGS